MLAAFVVDLLGWVWWFGCVMWISGLVCFGGFPTYVVVGFLVVVCVLLIA